MISNLGAFRFVLVSRNKRTIKSLFLCTNANYESGLREAAIRTKQAVFPWELKGAKNARGT